MIVSKASGMYETPPGLSSGDINVRRFFLAQLHLESLAVQDNRRDLRRALGKLPSRLDETYDEAMRRIQSQNSAKRNEHIRYSPGYLMRSDLCTSQNSSSHSM